MSKFCTNRLSEDGKWHTVVLKDILLDLIARISSRVFLGDELFRDQEWLKVDC